MSKRMPKELGNTLADCLEVYAKINGKPLEYWIDLEAKYRRCQDQLFELMRIHWHTVKSGFEHLGVRAPSTDALIEDYGRMVPKTILKDLALEVANIFEPFISIGDREQIDKVIASIAAKYGVEVEG